MARAKCNFVRCLICTRFLWLALTFAFLPGCTLKESTRAVDDPPACKPELLADIDMRPPRILGFGAIVIPATLNGKSSAFVLDTGAERGTIRESDVRDLKQTEVEGSDGMEGVDGQELKRYANFSNLGLGPLILNNQNFLVVSDNATADTQTSGNLGANIFSSYNVEIDARQGKVRLFSQTGCGSEVVPLLADDLERIPFDLYGNWIVITITLNGKPLRAIIDTGASLTHVPASLQKKIFGDSLESTEHIALKMRFPFGYKSIDGVLNASNLQQWKSLKIGAIEFNSSVIDASEPSVDFQDVTVIGMRELRWLHLYIDYSKKILYMTRPNIEARTNSFALQNIPPTLGLDLVDLSRITDHFERPLTGDNLSSALRDINEAISITPPEAATALYSFRGLVNSAQGASQQAIADFTRAIELFQNSPPSYKASIYIGRGEEFLRIYDLHSAIVDFSKAIEFSPDNIGAYTDRAYAYTKGGDYQHALSDAKREIELNPKAGSAWVLQCWLQARLRHKAASGCDSMISKNNSDGFDFLANLNYTAGLYRAAILEYTRSIEGDPKDARALYARGSARLRCGNTEKGNSDIREAIQIDPLIKVDPLLKNLVDTVPVRVNCS